MRRVPALGLSAVLLLGAGTGCLVATVSGGSAGADTTLGGFTVSALAEASTGQYEQPNFPLPATPSLEFDEGYASTSDNYGPTGSAVASTLYPGQVVANAGPELALLVPGLPLPPAPTWPIEAVSTYPQTPNTASSDEPGVNMDATSTTNGNTATSTIGNDSPTAGSQSTTTTTPGLPDVSGLTGVLGGLLGSAGSGSSGTTPTSTGNPLGASSSIIGVGFSSGTSTSGASGASAVATATATDGGISILGGLITIGSVTSTATASSDGTTGTVTGSTVTNNVSIAGEAVTIDSSGIHADGESTPATTVLSTVNTLLGELGMTLTVTNPTDSVSGPSASRTLDGLKLTINLDTLDSAASTLTALLPASLTSQLPVALPDKQLLTMDFGTVTVSSTASPPFTDTGSSAATAVAPSSNGTGGSTGSSDLGNGDSGDDGYTAGTPGTPGTPATSGSPTGTGTEPASAVTPIFKGIGMGLVLLGLLASGLMAYAYKRSDDASELLGTSCADADPLYDRFASTGDALDELGGFTR